MKYLVTGGAGYIGSYVLREILKDGSGAICFDKAGQTPLLTEMLTEGELAKVSFINGDVTEPVGIFEAVSRGKVDIIIHMAALLVPESELPLPSVKVNIIGTQNVFEAARLFNVKKVIWASTTGVFGQLGDLDLKITDGSPVYQPTLLYGATKMFCEFLAGVYRKKYDLDIIGFRLGRVFGYGRMRGSGQQLDGLLKDVAQNRPAKIMDGDARIGYIHVADIAAAIKHASLKAEIKTKMFNLTDGRIYSGWKLADMVRSVRPDAIIEVLPGKGPFDCPVLDTTAAAGELGFVPEHTLYQEISDALKSR